MSNATPPFRRHGPIVSPAIGQTQALFRAIVAGRQRPLIRDFASLEQLEQTVSSTLLKHESTFSRLHRLVRDGTASYSRNLPMNASVGPFAVMPGSAPPVHPTA